VRGEGLGGSCDYVPGAGARDFLVLFANERDGWSASLCGSMTLSGPQGVAFEAALNAASSGGPPVIEPPETGDGPGPAGERDQGFAVGAWATVIVVAGIAAAGAAAWRASDRGAR
jgi:hypothetical protein